MSKYDRPRCDRGLERAIVLQILRKDREGGLPRAELEAEFPEIAWPQLRRAVKFLEGERVLVIYGEQAPNEHFAASLCAECLDELGLVSV